jgi:hypothetical protein
LGSAALSVYARTVTRIKEELPGEPKQVFLTAENGLVLLVQEVRIPDIRTEVRAHFCGCAFAFILLVRALLQDYVYVIAFFITALTVHALAFSNIAVMRVAHKGRQPRGGAFSDIASRGWNASQRGTVFREAGVATERNQLGCLFLKLVQDIKIHINRSAGSTEVIFRVVLHGLRRIGRSIPVWPAAIVYGMMLSNGIKRQSTNGRHPSGPARRHASGRPTSGWKLRTRQPNGQRQYRCNGCNALFPRMRRSWWLGIRSSHNASGNNRDHCQINCTGNIRTADLNGGVAVSTCDRCWRCKQAVGVDAAVTRNLFPDECRA